MPSPSWRPSRRTTTGRRAHVQSAEALACTMKSLPFRFPAPSRRRPAARRASPCSSCCPSGPPSLRQSPPSPPAPPPLPPWSPAPLPRAACEWLACGPSPPQYPPHRSVPARTWTWRRHALPPSRTTRKQSFRSSSLRRRARTSVQSGTASPRALRRRSPPTAPLHHPHSPSPAASQPARRWPLGGAAWRHERACRTSSGCPPSRPRHCRRVWPSATATLRVQALQQP
mmetsp:Transcript_104/g.365  ORF Transcript_104/g.365 Transcript_104/m.365 type:complete len:228 (-) Transcript_104:590-1273(-)